MSSALTAAILTLGLPLGLLALMPVVWALIDTTVAMCLLPLVPAGLVSGYLYAGAGARGAAVTGGAYVVIGLCLALLWATPTQFEDAGVLVSIVAALAVAIFLAYCGWAAWDVYHLAISRAPR